MRLALAAATLAAFTTTPAFAAELVTNGNFEAGNTGFTSTYTYQGGNTPPGSYYIFGPQSDYPQYGFDHTYNNGTQGKYLYVDANSNSDYFWSQTFNVAANSTYTLSYWLKNLNGYVDPLVRATANGVQVGTTYQVSNGTWQNVNSTFNSGAATSVTLRLFNDNHSYSYNDLGVDDISFVGPSANATPGAVPEPATWGMMIAGFGLAGSAMRRRRRAIGAAFA